MNRLKIDVQEKKKRKERKEKKLRNDVIICQVIHREQCVNRHECVVGWCSMFGKVDHSVPISKDQSEEQRVCVRVWRRVAQWWRIAWEEDGFWHSGACRCSRGEWIGMGEWVFSPKCWAVGSSQAG